MAIYIDLLDLRVTPATADETVDVVERVVENPKATLVGAHNLHSVYLFHTNDYFRRFYEAADLVLIDGWPVLAALNRKRSRHGVPGLSSEYRIGSTDWIAGAIQSDAVSRVCVLGASSTSNASFIERQQAINVDVEFMGHPADPWQPERLPELVEQLRLFAPHLTLIGMGMPLQEELALALKSAGTPGVIATVGGAIDQLSGAQAHAPRWTGRLRVEWAWRLCSHPRRLAYRYLVEPIKLLRVLRAAKRSAQ